jgi:hypothetical protein
MPTRPAGRKTVLAAVLLLISLLLVISAGCGGGEGEEGASELSIDELWNKVQEADAGIESRHMETVSYYENTQYGGGESLSIIWDFSGDDYHEQQLLLGQVFFESMRVGGKYYEKKGVSGTWEEMPVESASDEATEYTSRFMELPAIATSQERLGMEAIDGEEAEHIHFVLGTDGVNQLFSSQPSYDFSQSVGGEIDMWIDSSRYYLLRYELVIRNVPISEEMGYGDVRFVVNIRDFNEPIEITPPV